MGLDNPHVIDAASIDSSTGFAVLTIADSWDWADEQRHLAALEDKLQSYVRFVVTGEIWKSYPKGVGRPVEVYFVTKYPMPRSGLDFLDRASAVCAAVGIKTRHAHYAGDQGGGSPQCS